MWEAIPGSHNPLCILISFQFLRWHSLLPPPPSLQELWPGWLRQQANSLLVCSTSHHSAFNTFAEQKQFFLKLGRQPIQEPLYPARHAGRPYMAGSMRMSVRRALLSHCRASCGIVTALLEDLKRRFRQSWAPTCQFLEVCISLSSF